MSATHAQCGPSALCAYTCTAQACRACTDTWPLPQVVVVWCASQARLRMLANQSRGLQRGRAQSINSRGIAPKRGKRTAVAPHRPVCVPRDAATSTRKHRDTGSQAPCRCRRHGAARRRASCRPSSPKRLAFATTTVAAGAPTGVASRCTTTVRTESLDECRVSPGATARHARPTVACFT